MFTYGVLAQLVEQRTLNPFVASSILARPTNKYKASRAFNFRGLFLNGTLVGHSEKITHNNCPII